MPENQKPQSWWQTLPGILTAMAGVITAIATLIGVLSQSGMFDDKTTPQPQVAQPAAPAVPAPPAEVTPKHPSEQTTDGWTIIGKSKQGKFLKLKLMVHGDSPAIGRHYDAVENFRLVQKRPKNEGDQGQVVTLGMVHRGDSVELLDIFIKTPSTQTVPVWAKLRAVLKKR